jgi:hypothetical protein
MPSSPFLSRRRSWGARSDTIGHLIRSARSADRLLAYLVLRTHPQGFHIIFLSAFAIGILAVVSLLFVTEVMGDMKKNISLLLWVIKTR